MASKLVLYDHPISPYAQKVRMALRLKNISFTAQTPKNFGFGRADAEPAFSTANPRMEVPTLMDGDFAVFDSSAILMYLEDKFPERALLPTDARARAQARIIEQVIDRQYEPINWALGEVLWFGRAEGAEAERLKQNAHEQTAQIQSWLAAQLGDKPFFNGETIGYADVCVVPVLNSSVMRGNAPAEGSALQLWHVRVNEVPCVKETVDEGMAARQEMLLIFNKDTWAPGRCNRREYRDHRLEWMVKNGAIGIVTKGLRTTIFAFLDLTLRREVESRMSK